MNETWTWAEWNQLREQFANGHNKMPVPLLAIDKALGLLEALEPPKDGKPHPAPGLSKHLADHQLK